MSTSTPVDYSGHWVPDLANTDNYEDILRVQGLDPLRRKVALSGNIKMENSEVTENGFRVLRSISTATILFISRSRTQTFILDGLPHTIQDEVLGDLETTAQRVADGNVHIVSRRRGPDGSVLWETSVMWFRPTRDSYHKIVDFRSSQLNKKFKQAYKLVS